MDPKHTSVGSAELIGFHPHQADENRTNPILFTLSHADRFVNASRKKPGSLYSKVSCYNTIVYKG